MVHLTSIQTGEQFASRPSYSPRHLKAGCAHAFRERGAPRAPHLNHPGHPDNVTSVTMSRCVSLEDAANVCAISKHGEVVIVPLPGGTRGRGAFEDEGCQQSSASAELIRAHVMQLLN